MQKQVAGFHPDVPVPALAPANEDTTLIRTLVVDDTSGTLEAITMILSRHARIEIVATASNGLAAIERARSLRPDLIVMDINMPLLNGLQAALNIKRRMPETKILLMSADDSPTLAFSAMDCGADGFIPKARLARDCQWHIDRLFSHGNDARNHNYERVAPRP